MAYTKSNVLRILIVLGNEGAVDKACNLTTIQIAEKLDVSQQTASRWLEELSTENYIEKNLVGQGLQLKITEKGKAILKKAHTDLQLIFHELPHQIRGQLAKGLGEGGYYIALPGYLKQFEKKLNFTPFAGTLNLRLVTEEDLEAFQLLLKNKIDQVEGFFHEETKRTLGKVFIWKCEIHYAKNKKVDGAIIYPDRTHHHQGIMEVLAPFSIREEWKVEDGDTIVIRPNQPE